MVSGGVSSGVPGFKAALYQRLLTDPLVGAANPPVQVVYGPSARAVEKEVVQLLGAQSTQEWAALGRGQREERFTLMVEVHVRATSDHDPHQPLTERAYQIAGAVAESLRAWGDQSAFDCLVRVAAVDRVDLAEDLLTDGGRRTLLTLHIACENRI